MHVGEAVRRVFPGGAWSAKAPDACEGRKRPLSGPVAGEPTVGVDVSKHSRSCCGSLCGWCADRCAALEDVDDDHRRATVPADEARREIAGWIIGSGGLRAGGRDL